MHGRQLDQVHHVGFRFNIEDDIGYPIQAGIEHFVDFIRRCLTVTVQQAFTRIERVLRCRKR